MAINTAQTSVVVPPPQQDFNSSDFKLKKQPTNQPTKKKRREKDGKREGKKNPTPFLILYTLNEVYIFLLK